MTTEHDGLGSSGETESLVVNSVNAKLLGGGVLQAGTINGGVHFHSAPSLPSASDSDVKNSSVGHCSTGRSVGKEHRRFAPLPTLKALKSMRISEVIKLALEAGPKDVAELFVVVDFDMDDTGAIGPVVEKYVDLPYFVVLLGALPAEVALAILREVYEGFRYKIVVRISFDKLLAIVRLMNDSEAADTLDCLWGRKSIRILAGLEPRHAYKTILKTTRPRFRSSFDTLPPVFVAEMLRGVDTHTCLHYLTEMQSSKAAAVLGVMDPGSAVKVINIMKPDIVANLLKRLPVEVRAKIG